MHGLVNKAYQSFLRDTFGAGSWMAVAQAAELGFDSFETLVEYDPDLTERMITASVELLGRPRDSLLEDMGTYLISHPNTATLSRLLRFGGVSFEDFLHSLDDLPERARLALPNLQLPLMELTEITPERFTVHVDSPIVGGGHVLVGLLRAMADEYGALAVMEHQGHGRLGEVVGIHLLEQGFTAGRVFELAMAGIE